MSTSSAQMPIIPSELTATRASHSDGELEGLTPPVSFVSCLTLHNFSELGWSKSPSKMLGGRTVQATARIIDMDNVRCTITVEGKSSGKNAYFDFGTKDGSPYAGCRSDTARDSITVPPSTPSTDHPAHTAAMNALGRAIKQPTGKLLTSLVKGWPKDKDDLEYLLSKVALKVVDGIAGDTRATQAGWTELLDEPGA